MCCFVGCFRGFRKSCSEFRARLRGRLARRKVVPTDVAASDPVNEQQKVPISEPTVASSSSMTQENRPTSKTPEALNQVVEEIVEYELQKIKALSQIEDDNIADDLITSGATLNDIYEAVHKERTIGMPRVDC